MRHHDSRAQPARGFDFEHTEAGHEAVKVEDAGPLGVQPFDQPFGAADRDDALRFVTSRIRWNRITKD